MLKPDFRADTGDSGGSGWRKGPARVWCASLRSTCGGGTRRIARTAFFGRFVLLFVLVSFRLAVHNQRPRVGGVVRRLLMMTSLCLVGVFVLAPNALAQGSFCTTTAAASGASVTKCVDAPSPTPSATASPDVTVISGGPLTPSPTATATASGSAAVVAAVGGRLPATGGAGRLALIAAALLLGSGVLSYFILRRA